MKNTFDFQRLKFYLALFTILLGINFSIAQDTTTVDAMNEDISSNLDLEAVASLFGESKDLEDFENKLNDPKTQLSNLDLNEDNQVDYLRVVEEAENDTHLVLIQAVLGDDLYQDVATVEVEKDSSGNTRVQVVGDVYMYGANYIIEPVYVRPPVIFGIFWRPFYRPYRSVYYWGYYPRHFHYWHPFRTPVYRKNVHIHINVHHKYHRVHVRRSKRAVYIHAKHRRNDFGIKHPKRAHAIRKQNRQIHKAKKAQRVSRKAQKSRAKNRKKAKKKRNKRKAKGKTKK